MASFSKSDQEKLKIIITDPGGAQTLVQYAEEIGKTLSRQLTTNQIRAIFGEVRRIEGQWKPHKDPSTMQEKAELANRQLTLLKPKMAYRARKERGRGVQELVDVLTPAIDLVDGNYDHFTRFVDFFEAILAYHKAYGGN